MQVTARTKVGLPKKDFNLFPQVFWLLIIVHNFWPMNNWQSNSIKFAVNTTVSNIIIVHLSMETAVYSKLEGAERVYLSVNDLLRENIIA